MKILKSWGNPETKWRCTEEAVEGVFPEGVSESEENAPQMICVTIGRVRKLLAYFAEQCLGLNLNILLIYIGFLGILPPVP